MQIKNHYNHWLPRFLRVEGVTIGTHIYYEDSNPPPTLIRHEMVHVKQYQQYGIVGYLIRYLYHYLKGRLKGLSHTEAYYKIPFEEEAFRLQEEENNGVS